MLISAFCWLISLVLGGAPAFTLSAEAYEDLTKKNLPFCGIQAFKKTTFDKIINRLFVVNVLVQLLLAP